MLEGMFQPYGMIYKTTNLVNNKVYIGQTIRIRNRSYMGSGHRLELAIKKYGRNNFKREIIGYCKSKEELDEAEKVCIEFYESKNRIYGYNVTEGGEGTPGYHYTEESRRIMSNHKKGIPLSEEHKNNMKGKVPWNKGVLSNNKGIPRSIEVRVKISNSHKGKNKTKEHIENLRNSSKKKKVIDINTLETFESVKELSIYLNKPYSSIKLYLNGNVKTPKWFTYKYVK